MSSLISCIRFFSFFFSSRRRHTRSVSAFLLNRSSDLHSFPTRRFKIVVIDIQITLKQMLRDFIGIRVNRAKKSGRSEERRVGKECRSRWWVEHKKKKVGIRKNAR